MKRTIPPALVLAQLLPCLMTGCVGSTRYEGDLKPISPIPKATHAYDVTRYWIVRVDSLHPTFRWWAADPSQTVDLAIWEAVWNQRGPGVEAGSYKRGSLVYSKERIVGGEHAVEKDLAPGTLYFWSIKLTGTMNWTTAREVTILDPNSYYEIRFFAIRTPAKP